MPRLRFRAATVGEELCRDVGELASNLSVVCNLLALFELRMALGVALSFGGVALDLGLALALIFGLAFGLGFCLERALWTVEGGRR